MSCLTPDQLARLAVGRPAARLRAHVAGCPGCAARLAELAAGLDRVAEAHRAAFDRDHAAGRARLLAALAAEPAGAETVPSSYLRKGFDMVRRNWGRGAVVAAAVTAAVAGRELAHPPSAAAQAGRAIRDAKSFRCDWVEAARDAAPGDDPPPVGRVCWAAAGVRLDGLRDGKPGNAEVYLVGKPGLAVDHDAKTYRRTGQEARHLFRVLGGLAGYHGRADRPVGPAEIGGVRADGFELALKEVDPLLEDEGVMRVWVDPATRRPVRLVLDSPWAKTLVRLDRFEWDVPADGWLDAAPPAGYADATPPPRSADWVTDRVVYGLKTYAKHAGHYPRARAVTGGRAIADLGRLLGGLPARPVPPGEPADGPVDETQQWQVVDRAVLGLGLIGTLQADNPDAAYHGLTVGPGDADKVLLRWQLDTGDYRVIFGDLKVQDVPAGRLKQLERR